MFEPRRGVFQLSVALPSTVAASCPQQWSSGHLALEERAEASPPLPVTGSIACAPALESVSVSSLLDAAFNWGRWLPSTVVVLPPGPGRTVAGDRDFCFVDGEVEGRRGAEHHAEGRVAYKNPARGAQPVRLRLAKAAHIFSEIGWPMADLVRRKVVIERYAALRCLWLARDTCR